MKPLLTFYGDDFTGSSAVMEVLSFAGVPTMLFIEPPTLSQLKKYPHLKAVGVAGIARAKNPIWMQKHLPKVFLALKKLNAPIVHYKVCSTFDSSPTGGSIGKATEIGKKVFKTKYVPLIVGAPALGRYQFFGQLFARADDTVYRLDQHPVMSCHPTTPMHEADLGKHLSKQTKLKVGVIDFLTLQSNQVATIVKKLITQGNDILSFDVMNEQTLIKTGQSIWQESKKPLFVVGSQGVEYALVAYWQHIKQLKQFKPPKLKPVKQLFAVSGSCSPTTAKQISYARQHNFKIMKMDASTAVDVNLIKKEINRICDQSIKLLNQGHDVLVITAKGPTDPAVANLNNLIKKSNKNASQINSRLGKALGQIVLKVRQQTKIKRVAISGGDTSGYALSILDVQALSPIAPLAPGAPLCKVHSVAQNDIDGLEITLKGGQMGEKDFFVQTKTGKSFTIN